MNRNDDLPEDIRFQRHQFDGGLGGASPEGSRTRKRNFALSPEAYSGLTGEKSLRRILADRLRTARELLK